MAKKINEPTIRSYTDYTGPTGMQNEPGEELEQVNSSSNGTLTVTPEQRKARLLANPDVQALIAQERSAAVRAELEAIQIYTDPSHQKMSPYARLKEADKQIRTRLDSIKHFIDPLSTEGLTMTDEELFRHNHAALTDGEDTNGD